MKRALLIAAGALLVAPTPAGAITAKFLRHHPTSVHFRSYRISGHRVEVASWRPGNHYVRALVGYSRHRKTVTGWAQARRSSSRAVAAMNGGTWLWRNNRPIGTVWSRGRRITRVSGRPAVGFLSRGRVVFGARSARRRGSGNILAGEAVLIRHGRVLTRYPWATAAQETCGARGTDGGTGCFRSNVVRFKGGRVGFVEIAFATMRQAAAILHSMHVTAAVTYDSGGSAILWRRTARGGCADRRARGGCFGITSAIGLRWERQVPDALILSVRRRPR